MAITVSINGADVTNRIQFPHLSAVQNLTNEVDTASFRMLATSDHLLQENGSAILQENRSFILINRPPSFNDDVVITDGVATVFAGKISRVTRTIVAPDNIVYAVSCIDHSFQMDRLLVARIYEDETVGNIIADIIATFAPGYTTTNVSCDFVVGKIVFNHLTITQCLRKLSDIVRYDWYVDEDKDVHFFPSSTNVAPFDLTDTTGSHVFRSLVRTNDGSQLVNRVKVRGGEYDGTSYTDTITVSGNATKSFVMPYKMSNLQVELDTGSGFVAQDVGIDFIDTFPDFDVLHSFQTQSFRFENALSAGNKVRFTGNPKTPVVAILEDQASVEQYGPIEKLVRDTAILNNTIARKRAAAELMTYASEAIDARFRTYVGGLRTGMLLNVNTAGYTDELLIKQVTFSGRTKDSFEYSVACISTQRYTLLDLLRKIVAPEPQETDEREIAEQLYAANQNITVSGSASPVSYTNVPTILNTLDMVSFSTGSTSFAFDCTGATALIIPVVHAINITSITYNGSPLTVDGTVGPSFNSAIYRLNSPTTGINNITITGASFQFVGRAYAVSGINTSDPVEGSAASSVNPTEAQHLSLAVTQANSGIWSIGFMFRRDNDPGAPARSYDPDTALDIEDYDGGVSGGSPMVHIMHRIFTRPGIKKMGSTYSVVPNNGGNEASFVLYNGLATH